MRFTFAFFLSLTIGLVLYMASPNAAAAEQPCAVENEKWSNSSNDLRDALDQYRQIKEESLGPEITELLSTRNKSRRSMARAVQSALSSRGDKLAEAGARCRELAYNERFAFDDLKRCVSGPSQRKNNNPVAALATVSRDRERLLKQMQDVMLDEAYVQYRGEREYSGGGYSDYGQNQASRTSYQRQAGPDYRMDRRWPDNYPNSQNPYGYYSR